MLGYFILLELGSDNVSVKKYVQKHINMKLLNNTKIKLSIKEVRYIKNKFFALQQKNNCIVLQSLFKHSMRSHQNNFKSHLNKKNKKHKTISQQKNLYYDSRTLSLQYFLPAQELQTQNFSPLTFQQNPKKNIKIKLHPDLKNIPKQSLPKYHNTLAKILQRSLEYSSKNFKQLLNKSQLMVSEQNIEQIEEQQYLKNIQNEKLHNNFLEKNQIITKQLILVQIVKQAQNNSKNNQCKIIFRNSIGMVLFFLNKIRIQENQKILSKKLQNIFRGQNLFLIINKSNGPSLNFIYFQKILDRSNQFIYIQQDYYFIKSDNNNSNHQNCYFYQLTDDHKINLIQQQETMMIFSQKAVSLYKNMQYKQIIKKEKQLLQNESKIIKQIYIDCPKNPSIALYLKYLVYNHYLSDIYQNKNTKINDIYTILINTQKQIAQQQHNKLIQDTQSNYKQHYPKIMDHCKLCRYCLKNSKQNTKNNKKKIRKLNYLKIKKTKYSCEGCSIQYGKDIPLCVVCFKQFHKNIEYYLDQQQFSLQKNTLEKKEALNYNVTQTTNANGNTTELLNRIISLAINLQRRIDELQSNSFRLFQSLSIRQNNIGCESQLTRGNK